MSNFLSKMFKSGANISTSDGTIKINGETYKVPVNGSLKFVGNNLYIDGVKTTNNPSTNITPEIKLEIISGNIQELISDGSISCSNIKGNVTTKGSVTCDDIVGDVTAGGSIRCDDIKGNVRATGSVSCDDIIGNIK